jgi:hypothetical protein
MTELSKSQLAMILSALDGTTRNPANKDTALKAITKSAERLRLSADEILAASPGLLDGRLTPEAWRAGLSEPKPRRQRKGTKQAQLIAMLRRPEGATISQIVQATGWQQHTVRGAIAGALKKKLGLEVTSTKEKGEERVYRIGEASREP